MINFDAVGRPVLDQRAVSRVAAERHAQLAAVAGARRSGSRPPRVTLTAWVHCRGGILRWFSRSQVGCARQPVVTAEGKVSSWPW